MNSRKVLYPGTFDPITRGHEDMCERALKIFDGLILGVAASPGKNPFFSVDERIELAREVFADEPRIEVSSFSGLLVDFARDSQCCVVLRGLRAIADFEYEVQLAGMNRRLSNDMETVFMNADEKYAFVSSSLVREIASLGGNVSDFLHPKVEQHLLQRLASAQ